MFSWRVFYAGITVVENLNPNVVMMQPVCVANCYLLPGSTIRPHTRSAQ
jgi:hypothetical protein